MPLEEGIEEPSAHEVVLEGIAGSPGLALGPAIVLDRRTGVVRRHIPNHQIDDELDRFDQAIHLAAKTLSDAAERSRGSRAESSILEAYVMMVKDETLKDEIERRIRIDRLCVEWALTVVVDEMAERLSQAEDSYLAERSHDIQFVGQSILRALAGRAEPVTLLPGGKEPGVLVALYVGTGAQNGEGSRPFFAVRPGASGDITPKEGETANAFVAWKQPKASGYTPSALVHDNRVYLVHDTGVMGVYAADNGRELFKARVGGVGHTFSASPVAVGNRLYFLDEEGTMIVLAAGDSYKELAQNALDEMTLASPAVAERSLFIRTESKLYRIQQ